MHRKVPRYNRRIDDRPRRNIHCGNVVGQPSEFVPLDEQTQPIIEEIQALQEQRAGLDSEIVSLYEKLERFKIAKS